MPENASVPDSRQPEGGGPGVQVRGRVSRPDGTALADAALTLVDDAGRQRCLGAADGDGRYRLHAPATGRYVLIAAAEGYRPQAVGVTAEDVPVEIDLVLAGAGRLAGRVVTAEGRPVADATLTLTDGQGEVIAAVRSGVEGDYSADHLVAGAYTLAVTAPSCRPVALPVSLRAGRETRQDVELPGGVGVRGTVRAPGGRPVAEARVTLLDGAGNVVDTAVTAGDGAYRFTDLASGDYTVIAAGYPPTVTALQVVGGRTERDLRLGYGN